MSRELEHGNSSSLGVSKVSPADYSMHQSVDISSIESVVTSGGIDDHRRASGIVVQSVQVDLVVSAWL